MIEYKNSRKVEVQWRGENIKADKCTEITTNVTALPPTERSTQISRKRVQECGNFTDWTTKKGQYREEIKDIN